MLNDSQANANANANDAAPVRLRRPDRSQVEMALQCPDDLVPAGHPARSVWAVVQGLDLAAFAAPIRARAGVGGRDATDPALLVSLWLYAAIRGVGSARELARLCVESAPYRWLCGGVTLNHHTLSDFRVGHAAALDGLFTRLIAALVAQGLVRVRRISQAKLEELLGDAEAHLAALHALDDDGGAGGNGGGRAARRAAARERAARERVDRVRAAIVQLPELERRQAERATRVAKADRARKLKEPRASTTDAEARVMKMGDGGFDAAVNVQLAVDTESRAIVGVDVVAEGTDAGQAEPMREQVERRTGRRVEEHLMDGGYLVLDELGRAADAGVTLFVPPPPARAEGGRVDPDPRARYLPRPGDAPAVAAWRERMGTPEAQEVYRGRASTVETANADVKTHRGLARLTVRGLAKARCVALWSALAYNVMRFGRKLAAR